MTESLMEMLESSSNESDGSDEFTLFAKRQKQTKTPQKQAGKRRLLDSEEEIKKWINARRQNFPCKENQWKKARDKEEREKTGEVNTEEELSLLEKKMRKKIAILNGPEDRAAKQKERNRKFLLHDLMHGSKMAPTRSYSKWNNFEQKDAMKKPGQNGSNFDPNSKIQENLDPRKRQEKNPLNYEKEEDHPENENCEEKNNDTKKSEHKKESTYEEMLESIKKKTEVDLKEFEEFSETGKGPIHTSGQFWYMQNSLMENILVDEILRERSVLLQAIRYIVTNNFLQ
jgi:Nuclear fragile X mental retardation-interacting protein 1 (NUFIP1)